MVHRRSALLLEIDSAWAGTSPNPNHAAAPKARVLTADITNLLFAPLRVPLLGARRLLRHLGWPGPRPPRPMPDPSSRGGGFAGPGRIVARSSARFETGRDRVGNQTSLVWSKPNAARRFRAREPAENPRGCLPGFHGMSRMRRSCAESPPCRAAGPEWRSCRWPGSFRRRNSYSSTEDSTKGEETPWRGRGQGSGASSSTIPGGSSLSRWAVCVRPIRQPIGRGGGGSRRGRRRSGSRGARRDRSRRRTGPGAG